MNMGFSRKKKKQSSGDKLGPREPNTRKSRRQRAADNPSSKPAPPWAAALCTGASRPWIPTSRRSCLPVLLHGAYLSLLKSASQLSYTTPLRAAFARIPIHVHSTKLACLQLLISSNLAFHKISIKWIARKFCTPYTCNYSPVQVSPLWKVRADQHVPQLLSHTISKRLHEKVPLDNKMRRCDAVFFYFTSPKVP